MEKKQTDEKAVLKSGGFMATRKRVSNEDLAVAILTTKTQNEAAEKVGIHTTTISQRRKDKDFQKVLSEMRLKMFQESTSLLVSASYKAVETLVEMLKDDNSYSRYNAASKILQLAGENLDREELLNRIIAIEEKQEQAEERE